MDTFEPARPVQPNPGFEARRAEALRNLALGSLDPPLLEPVRALNRLPFCFSLQSCHGHIVIPGSGSPSSWQRQPAEEPPPKALYQLAYIALVIQNQPEGLELLKGLAAIAADSPDYMQMGSAAWFWSDQGQINSFVLQVSPQRFATQDRFEMLRPEALAWLEARKVFMGGLAELLL